MEGDRISKAMRRANYEALAASGAASGAGNRARTMRSKRDKAMDARRQRKRRDWARGD